MPIHRPHSDTRRAGPSRLRARSYAPGAVGDTRLPWHACCNVSPAREGPMTSALEIGGAFLLMATLLIAGMLLAAFQLGRLITRDDEQREVEVGRMPRMAVHDFAMATAGSRGAGSGSST